MSLQFYTILTMVGPTYQDNMKFPAKDNHPQQPRQMEGRATRTTILLFTIYTRQSLSNTVKSKAWSSTSLNILK